MTEDEIDNVARRMLAEMVVRHVRMGSDEWYSVLARHCPEATVTDREYVAMRSAEMIDEWHQKNHSQRTPMLKHSTP